MPQVIVFTDLDGTLLDHETYSVRAALPAIDLLARRSLPVIPVSSKTAAEMRQWVKLLDLGGPYVSENGCGIRIPEKCFDMKPPSAVAQGGEWKISLGSDIGTVKRGLSELAEIEGFEYRTFDQMSPEELSSLTGLTGEELVLCMEREYDVPFLITGDFDEGSIGKQAARMDLHFTRGGRFYHLTGGCNKGKAVRLLADLYREKIKDPLFISIGDSYNDLPMFAETDMAFLVQKPDGSYDPHISENAARRVRGVGPAGWRAAVEEVMTFG